MCIILYRYSVNKYFSCIRILYWMKDELTKSSLKIRTMKEKIYIFTKCPKRGQILEKTYCCQETIKFYI